MTFLIFLQNNKKWCSRTGNFQINQIIQMKFRKNARFTSVLVKTKWLHCWVWIRPYVSKRFSTDDRRDKITLENQKAKYMILPQQNISNISFSNLKKKFRTENEILKQSHSPEKCERGDPVGFFKLQFVENWRRNFWSLTVPKNILVQ